MKYTIRTSSIELVDLSGNGLTVTGNSRVPYDHSRLKHRNSAPRNRLKTMDWQSGAKLLTIAPSCYLIGFECDGQEGTLMDETFKYLYPNLAFIPEEILATYDLEEEASAYQLHRLFDIVGLDTIIKSASAQQNKYPGTKLYVSTLRRKYKRFLPRDFYLTPESGWIVYLLITTDRKDAKIGISSNIQKRAFTLSGNNYWQSRPVINRFDLENSLVISGFASKKEALAVERAIKEATIDASKTPDRKTEWRHYTEGFLSLFYSFAGMYEGLKVSSAHEYAALHPKPALLERLPLS